MIQILGRILLIIISFIAYPFTGEARTWSVDNLEMVHLKDARRYVCDPDGYMRQAERDSTDAILQRLERDKGVETVVVVAEHLEGDDPFQFGIDLSRKYGIGSKKSDTGLIIILSPGDRSYYILTGRGLEGTLPDAICKRVENQVMLPLLKEKRWGEAIYATVSALDKIIRGDSTVIKEADETSENSVGFVLFIIFIFASFIFLIAYSAQPRCPKCNKKSLKAYEQKTVRTAHGMRLMVTYRCTNCGHIVTKQQDPPSTGSGNLATGILLGALLGGGGRNSGGGFGDGGFGGGSFGGGSFGGGGAGGRF